MEKIAMTPLHVGIVGFGKMGSAFARRLIDRGYAVSGWDRSPGRVSELGAGVTACASIAALASSVEVVIVMLWGDDAAREVTLAQVLPAMHSPELLIEMSTLSPGMYETLEQAARQREIDFVAAPVLGNPEVVRAGSETVLAGGSAPSIRRAAPILSSLGTVIELNSAQASGYLKLSNNAVLGVVAETLGELFEMCDRAGIDRELAIRTLTGTFQRATEQKVSQLLEDDSEPRFTLNALLKDLRLAEGAAKAIGVPVPVLQGVVPQAELAVKQGLGDRDYIVLALERPKSMAPLEAAQPSL